MDINISSAKNKIEEKGFLDIDVDPSVDLFLEIERLKNKNKKERQQIRSENAVER